MFTYQNMYSCKVALVLLLSFLFQLLNNIPTTAYPLSFNLSNVTPNDAASFNLSRDAYITSDGLQLTPPYDYNKTGWAAYTTPFQLWNSDGLASFSSHFSFVLTSNMTNRPQGFAFRLMAPPSNSSYVDIEFGMGIYYRDSAPQGVPQLHVGVDVDTKTVTSTNAFWIPDVYYLPLTISNAWISYDASSFSLMVNFTVYDTATKTLGTKKLSCVLDLRSVLPENVTVGFVAETSPESYTGINNIKSWDFSSTSLSVFEANPPVFAPSSTNINSTSNKLAKGHKKSLFVVGLTVGLSAVALIMSAFIGYCLWKQKCKGNDGSFKFINPISIDEEFEKGTGPKKFSFGELARATKNFSEEKKLGGGGFGGVYRGLLKDTDIAVKRVSRGSSQGVKEYESEVKIISRLRHKNLVQLLGWCHERGELLLVYNFMPNGSLDYHLFNRETILPWETRYKIAQGLAAALLYLHEGWDQCVLHRDIKTSNVMLDSKFDTKLGDFGLARLVDHEKGSQTTAIAGTFGYMAPEYIITGRASKESDVYSFGVVLLEIACGRRATFNFADQSDPVRLFQWAWDLYAMDTPLDAADPKLREEDIDEREMEIVIVVGLWCVHPDSSRRPLMREVMSVLNFEAPLPSRLSLMAPTPLLYMNPMMGQTVGSGRESSGMRSTLGRASGANTSMSQHSV